MKMKKKKTILLCFMPFAVYANTEFFIAPSEYASSPRPYEGFKVVPSSSLGFSKQDQYQLSLNDQQREKFGYIKKYSAEANFLLNIEKNTKSQILKNKYMNNPHDTSMKESLDQIKLAFDFHGFSFIPQENVIGYGAMGQWENGWTGINEYFKDKELGSCVVAMNNIPLTGMSATISEKTARYDINKSPNTLTVSGSSKSGYNYDISWANSNFAIELQCANTVYDKTLTQNLIDMANKIEKETIHAKMPFLSDRTKKRMQWFKEFYAKEKLNSH